jgi:hypothetical protein
MRKALFTAAVLALCASVSAGQSLGGTHKETGVVLGAFSGGIFNFTIPHPYTPACGLRSVTLFLSLGDPRNPVPVACGPVMACQCWGLQEGARVTITGRIVGNGGSPGDVGIAPSLHVATLTVNH